MRAFAVTALIFILFATTASAITYQEVNISVDTRTAYAFPALKGKGVWDSGAGIIPPYALVQIENTTYVIDLWEAQIVTTEVENISNVRRVAVAAEGTDFYVALGNGSVIALFKVTPPDTFSSITIINQSCTLTGMFASGNVVWVSAWDDVNGVGKIIRWDGVTAETYDISSVEPVSISGNGTHLFVLMNSSANLVEIIDTSTMAKVKTISTTTDAYGHGGLAVAGKTLYVLHSNSTHAYITAYDMATWNALWSKYISSSSAEITASKLLYDSGANKLLFYLFAESSTDPAPTLTVFVVEPDGTVNATYYKPYTSISDVVYYIPAMFTIAGNNVSVLSNGFIPYTSYDTLVAGYRSSFSVSMLETTTIQLVEATPTYSVSDTSIALTSSAVEAVALSTVSTDNPTPDVTIEKKNIMAYVYPDKVVFSAPVVTDDGKIVTAVYSGYRGSFKYLGGSAGEYIKIGVLPIFSNVSIDSVTSTGKKITLTLATKGVVAFPTSFVSKVVVNGTEVPITKGVVAVDPVTIEIYLSGALGGEASETYAPLLLLVVAAILIAMSWRRFMK